MAWRFYLVGNSDIIKQQLPDLAVTTANGFEDIQVADVKAMAIGKMPVSGDILLNCSGQADEENTYATFQVKRVQIVK